MWDIRAITADETDMFRKRLSAGFGQDTRDDDRSRNRFAAIFDLSRTFAAFEVDEIIGTGSGFSLEVTVPGAPPVPMGGTTVISVLPTHRRRGVLTEMMKWHLDDVSARGEPVAGLWASEGSIYRRFGYGVATQHCEVSFDAGGVDFIHPPGDGTLRLIDTREAAKVFPRIFESVRGSVPGMLSRSDAWWRERVLADVEEWREGNTALRHLLYERDGEALGYALYRQKEKWKENLPRGEVHVEEIITDDSIAQDRIWSFLSNIDLFPEVEYWNAPIDDPLAGQVTNSKRLRRVVADALWIRIMDVAAALQSRLYESDGSITFEAIDRFRSDGGTFRLEVVDGMGSCSSTVGPADVTLDIDVLGHLYLGGGNAITMERAGRLIGDPDSVTTLHRLFRTDRAPWCQEVF